MKTTTKNWLITAFVLIICGIMLFCWAMRRHSWDFAMLSTEKTVTSVYEIKEDFRNLAIRSDTEDIDFLPSESELCRVVFNERENESHTAYVDGDTLVIEETDTGKRGFHFSLFSFGPANTTIYLPRSEYVSLSLEESTGKVRLPGDFSFESIDISASTGDVECCASAAGPIRIKTDTGDIRTEGLSAGELTLSVSTGRVDVRSVKCAGDVSVKVTTGKAVLTDTACGSFSSRGSTGNAELKNVTADGMISIERTTGSVKLDRCDASELEIKTSTGSVSGSLLSEKVFIARSDTGSIRVPETVTGGKCKITTSTGSISITIA